MEQTQTLLAKIAGTEGFDEEAVALRARGYAVAGMMELMGPEAERAAWRDLQWSIDNGGGGRARHLVGASALAALTHSAVVALDERERDRLNGERLALLAQDPSLADEV